MKTQGEQLQLMKVIEFPKNRLKENKDRLDKLEVAYKILKYLAEEGEEFHIILEKSAALKLFDDTDNQMKDYFILTTDFEKAKDMKLKLTQSRNSIIQSIKGNEL